MGAALLESSAVFPASRGNDISQPCGLEGRAQGSGKQGWSRSLERGQGGALVVGWQ